MLLGAFEHIILYELTASFSHLKWCDWKVLWSSMIPGFNVYICNVWAPRQQGPRSRVHSISIGVHCCTIWRRYCRCQNINENTSHKDFHTQNWIPSKKCPWTPRGLPRSRQRCSMADMADDLYATVADLQDGCVLSAREKAQFVLAGFVKALR